MKSQIFVALLLIGSKCDIKYIVLQVVKAQATHKHTLKTTGFNDQQVSIEFAWCNPIKCLQLLEKSKDINLVYFSLCNVW